MAALASAVCAMTGMLILSACSSSSAPDHTDAWLSYKYAQNCGNISQSVNSSNPSCTQLQSSTASPGNAEAFLYYQAIGALKSVTNPNGTATNLTSWEAEFGFPGAAAADHATYANQLDLQLGRDMYCWQSSNTIHGPVIACFVSNYGPPPYAAPPYVVPGNPSFVGENPLWPNAEQGVDCALTLSCNAAQNPQPFATVAMAYAAGGIGVNKDQVTFYVFDENGNLAPAAALDGEGPKTVPRMCMACHGGTYDPTQHSVGASGQGHTSSFLPFDVQGFYYSQNLPGHGIDDQQENFRKLNVDVLATNPAPAVQGFVNDLYHGQVNTFGTTVPDDSYVPSSWQTPDGSAQKLYKGVFRNYCRMCHLAQDPPADFSSYAGFQALAGATAGLVCGATSGSNANPQGHDMPHAEVPFGGLAGSNKFSALDRFWWNPVAIQDLNTFLQQQGQGTNVCQQP